MLRGKKTEPGSMNESTLQRKENAGTIDRKGQRKINLFNYSIRYFIGTNKDWKRQIKTLLALRKILHIGTWECRSWLKSIESK